MRKYLLVLLLSALSVAAQSGGAGTGGSRVSKQICTAADAYTVLNGDQGMLLWSNDSNNCIVTLPQAGTSSAFMANWYADFKNLGTGVMTIVPTTSTCDGQVSCFIGIGGGVGVVSDGTNYETDGKSAPIVLYRGWSNATATNCISADGGSYNPIGSSGSATCPAGTSITTVPIFSFTVPANFFATNHLMRIEEFWIGTSSSSAPTLNITVQANGTTVWTGTATAPGNSLTGRTMQLTFNCSGNAALNSSTGGMECLMVAAGAYPGGGMTTAVTVNSAALNTTAAIPMTTRVTWGAGTAGNYVMGRQINVLGIPY